MEDICGQYTANPTSGAVYTEGWKPVICGARKVPISGKHEHTSFSNDIIKCSLHTFVDSWDQFVPL